MSLSLFIFVLTITWSSIWNLNQLHLLEFKFISGAKASNESDTDDSTEGLLWDWNLHKLQGRNYDWGSKGCSYCRWGRNWLVFFVSSINLHILTSNLRLLLLLLLLSIKGLLLLRIDSIDIFNTSLYNLAVLDFTLADCWVCRILLLRNKWPDTNDIWVQSGRRRQVPSNLLIERNSPKWSLRGIYSISEYWILQQQYWFFMQFCHWIINILFRFSIRKG